MDLDTGRIQNPLPFGEPFALTGSVPRGVLRIDGMWYRRNLTSATEECDCASNRRYCRLNHWIGPGDRFRFQLRELKVDHSYCFCFTQFRQPDKDTLATLESRVSNYLDPKLRNTREPDRKDAEYSTRLCSNIARISSDFLGCRYVGNKLHHDYGSFSERVCKNRELNSWCPQKVSEILRIQRRRQQLIDELDDKYNYLYTALSNLATAIRDHGILGSVSHQSFQSDRPLIRLGLSDYNRVDKFARSLDSIISASNQTILLEDSQNSNLWFASQVDHMEDNTEDLRSGLERIAYVLKENSSNDVFENDREINVLWKHLKAASVYNGKILQRQSELKKILNTRSNELSDLTSVIRNETRFITSRTTKSTTDSLLHISADMGLLHAVRLREMTPYVGVNIYTSPVNRRIPRVRSQSFRKRLSFTVGATVYPIENLKDSQNPRKDLFGSQSMISGIGFRFIKTLRGSLGGLIFKRLQDCDSNSENCRERLGGTFYYAVSYDWNVSGAFVNLAKIVGIF